MDAVERLKEIRQEFNLSQAKFAQELNLNTSVINSIELNRGRVTPEIAKKIEERFNVNLRWILFGEGEKFISKTVVNISEEDIKLTFFEPRAINIEGYLKENKDYKDYLIFKKRYIKHVLNADPDNVSLMIAMTISFDNREKYINHGDLIMYDKSQNEAYEEGIYVVRFTSDFVIAQIKQIDNKIKLIYKESPNPDHPSYTHSLEDPLEVEIQGKVVWVGKKFPPLSF